jgi:hypothetical protein
MKLDWTRHRDDYDNVFLEAESPYYDQGTVFHWRLRQRLANNQREWWDDSDAELGGRGDGAPPYWNTQASAEAAIQKAHDAILSKIANETISSEEIMSDPPRSDMMHLLASTQDIVNSAQRIITIVQTIAKVAESNGFSACGVKALVEANDRLGDGLVVLLDNMEAAIGGESRPSPT